MKTIRIMLTILLAVVTGSSMAQGVIIYKSNGTQEKLPYVAVDSIIMYYADQTPVQITTPKPVDLGLPSGTLWADMNVGASAPEAHGGYYAFGETEEKLTYSWSTYLCQQSDCGKSSDPLYADGLLTCTWVGGYAFYVKCIIAGTKYDVATQKWGESWVMPTAQQFQELFDYCTRANVKINDVDCAEYTGPNGNTLIIPLSGGYKENKELTDADIYTHPTRFWIADFDYDPKSGGNATVTASGQSVASNVFNEFRYRGKQIRPVSKYTYIPTKHYIYGKDPVAQPPFQPVTWDAASMRFSDTDGAHFPTISDDVYFGLKTLIVDVADASDDCDMKVMNGWWSNTYYDHVKLVSGLNEIKITETMAQECAQGGEGKDLDLMLYSGTCTIKSVYYEE